MKFIYVVFGQCGEYEDRREWPVISYTNQEKANKHADLATQFAARAYKNYSEEYLYTGNWETRVQQNPYDPDSTYGESYPHPQYHVTAIEIGSKVPNEPIPDEYEPNYEVVTNEP